MDAPELSKEQDLEGFFEDCRKQGFSQDEMKDICRPLVWHQRRSILRRWTQLFLMPTVTVYLLWNYCDTFAWTASAIGRLLLIQVLPYWNWTPYYYSRCLVERSHPEDRQMEQSKPLGRHETLWENCVLCETIDTIPTSSNVSFSRLEAEYLERGLPVIVTDCHLEMDQDELLQRIMAKASHLLTTEPCDVSTNLMLRNLFHLGVALEKIQATTPAAWHLQFRNCERTAVKDSRLYISRPYYYPKHLEPFYSSWLLLAHNTRRLPVDIYLRGLIFVQQLSGKLELRLRPKQPCNEDICPNLSMRLTAGECLVFSTDLWRLSYGMQKLQPSHTSIASILEVDWQL